MNENEPGPMENLLEGLDQQAQYLSKEELKEELLTRGIDIETFLKRAQNVIAKHDKAERLAWMKMADENRSRLENACASFESWLGKSEQCVKAAWAKFIMNVDPKRALAFRNRTDLTVDDMARILDDNERLRLSQSNKALPEKK